MPNKLNMMVQVLVISIALKVVLSVFGSWGPMVTFGLLLPYSMNVLLSLEDAQKNPVSSIISRLIGLSRRARPCPNAALFTKIYR